MPFHGIAYHMPLSVPAKHELMSDDACSSRILSIFIPCVAAKAQTLRQAGTDPGCRDTRYHTSTTTGLLAVMVGMDGTILLEEDLIPTSERMTGQQDSIINGTATLHVCAVHIVVWHTEDM